MPQFWIATFFILLAVAQVYQSIKDINLPLPVYLVLGTVLAVASNANQKLAFGASSDARVSIQEIKEPAPAISSPIASVSLVATQTPELAPAQIEKPQLELASPPVTLPKVAPKQTKQAQDLAPPLEEQPPKQAPKRKTTRKPKQV
jgi:hypothetical protein